MESITLTVDTGSNITQTQTYGIAWHNDNLFLSFGGVNKVYKFNINLELIEEISIIIERIAFVGNSLGY